MAIRPYGRKPPQSERYPTSNQRLQLVELLPHASVA